MKYDKGKCLKIYLEQKCIGLYAFSQMTGISVEDLQGIMHHVTIVNQSMSLALATHTDMKDSMFWTDSKGNY